MQLSCLVYVFFVRTYLRRMPREDKIYVRLRLARVAVCGYMQSKP